MITGEDTAVLFHDDGPAACRHIWQTVADRRRNQQHPAKICTPADRYPGRAMCQKSNKGIDRKLAADRIGCQSAFRSRLMIGINCIQPFPDRVKRGKLRPAVRRSSGLRCIKDPVGYLVPATAEQPRQPVDKYPSTRSRRTASCISADPSRLMPTENRLNQKSHHASSRSTPLVCRLFNMTTRTQIGF